MCQGGAAATWAQAPELGAAVSTVAPCLRFAGGGRQALQREQRAGARPRAAAAQSREPLALKSDLGGVTPDREPRMGGRPPPSMVASAPTPRSTVTSAPSPPLGARVRADGCAGSAGLGAPGRGGGQPPSLLPPIGLRVQALSGQRILQRRFRGAPGGAAGQGTAGSAKRVYQKVRLLIPRILSPSPSAYYCESYVTGQIDHGVKSPENPPWTR